MVYEKQMSSYKKKKKRVCRATECSRDKAVLFLVNKQESNKLMHAQYIYKGTPSPIVLAP
jgi:hypothetical protein